MTRSSTDPLHDLDLEIEITLCRLRKARKIVVNNSNNSNSISSYDNSSLVTNNSDSFEYSSTNSFVELEQMENNDRTLKWLATPDVYPQLESAQTHEWKSDLIHLLPKFHGLAGEDPHKNLKEFHVATRDTEGLYQNEGISIFLGWSCEGLPVFAASSLQHLGRHETHVSTKVLFGIQNNDHKEGNLWDKATFWRIYTNTRKDSTNYVPHVRIIRSYFYEGLTMMDQSMIDVASGGALMNEQDANNS
ncbi:hypothetical protein CR513_33612, partial [Mucuna pruriens]